MIAPNHKKVTIMAVVSFFKTEVSSRITSSAREVSYM